MIYVATLLLTLAVESLVASGFRDRRRILPALLALNLFTQPLATWAFVAGQVGFYAVETAVVVVEGAGLAWITGRGLPRMLLLSLVANGTTALLALVL